jgi:hypothetical protein
MPQLRRMHSLRDSLVTSILSHLRDNEVFRWSAICIMCLLPVSRLCIDTHSTQVAEDSRLCILFHAYDLVLEDFRYF